MSKTKEQDELSIANREIVFQNDEKQKRAAELKIANKELVFEKAEKKKRAHELNIANKELAFQNNEKENRAAELIIANAELLYQNSEKENRAAELIIANNELAFQNEEKENRAAELYLLNEELKAKEQQLSNHINAITISNATIEFDLNGTILNANDNFLKIMGYQEEDIKGKPHSIFVEPSYALSKEYKAFWDALKKGIYQKDEFKRLDKHGNSVWLLGSYNPILDTSGRPYKVLKIAIDITLVKKQFQQLASQAEEKERRTAELAMANQELAFLIMEKENRAAELIIANKNLAFQNDEKEKRAAELIIANKELAFQNDEKEKRAVELQIANKEIAQQNIQKEKRRVEKDKRAADLLLANRERVHQEKRAAELQILNKKLAFQNDEKEKRTLELMLANTELKKVQEELGSFSYSVSHDLRAPIRAINGYTRILMEDYATNFDNDGIKVLEAVMHSSKKMGELIDDLLAFSKLGRKQITAALFSMENLVDTVIQQLQPEAGESIPVFTISPLPTAYGDQSLIRQVWINLISNAVKYSKHKSEILIEIGAYANGDATVYYIKDSGAGFDMNYYDKLFGVFQRLHSQEEFDGTGIGLAIVQKIVDRHQGTVWAESTLNEGASFYFSLPNINDKL